MAADEVGKGRGLSLLDGTLQRRTAEAYELVKQLENAELLLQSTPDDHPLGDKERAQLTKLIKAIQQLHFARP